MNNKEITKKNKKLAVADEMQAGGEEIMKWGFWGSLFSTTPNL